MNCHLIISIALLTFSFGSQAQTLYSFKAEGGYLDFQNNTINVEPGPGWKGYKLEDRNGAALNIVNGALFFHERLFTGIGLGYQNFRGYSGISAFLDTEYLPLKTKLSPLANMKIGYNHLWNQYKGGTGANMLELSAGINYRINKTFGVFLKSGILFTQQSSLVPISVGIRREHFNSSHLKRVHYIL